MNGSSIINTASRVANEGEESVIDYSTFQGGCSLLHANHGNVTRRSRHKSEWSGSWAGVDSINGKHKSR